VRPFGNDLSGKFDPHTGQSNREKNKFAQWVSDAEVDLQEIMLQITEEQRVRNTRLESRLSRKIEIHEKQIEEVRKVCE
jgi:hypothetical protein